MERYKDRQSRDGTSLEKCIQSIEQNGRQQDKQT